MVFSMWRCSCVLASLLAAQSLAGAQSAAPSPADLLKRTMARYAAMPTFQADCNWSAAYGGLPMATSTMRTVQYAKPNRFKVVTSHSAATMVQTSVSDGKKLVESSTGVGMPAQSSPAPASIADAASMQMGHPMFCGSLLYKFFGGQDRYSALVDTSKMPISLGSPVKLDGQQCRTVTFYAQGPMYGKTEVAIGTIDGLVHRIRYGSEPLMQMMQSPASQSMLKGILQSPAVASQLNKADSVTGRAAMQNALNSMKNLPTSSLTTESYVHILVGKPIAPATFVTAMAKGQPVQELGGDAESKPPVALGKPAPDIRVIDINGAKRKLADFKGRVVLIDFWATWCPPCRKGLPETEKFFTKYGKKGLAVLTVSDEPKATVMPFVKENRYTFPVYLDPNDVTNKAYHIEAIPTTVVIDRNGRLVAYNVGLAPPEVISAALKKAGLATR